MVTVQNATELFSLKCLIFCYRNFTSVNKTSPQYNLEVIMSCIPELLKEHINVSYYGS